MRLSFKRLLQKIQRFLSSVTETARLVGGFIWRRVLLNQVARAWLLAIGFFFIMVTLLFMNLVPKQLNVQVGQKSPVDYEAPRGIENSYQMEQLRRKAAEAAYRQAVNDARYYIVSPAAQAAARQKLDALFEQIDWKREANRERVAAGKGPADETLLLRQVSEIQSRLADRVQAVMPPGPLGACLRLEQSRMDKVKKALEQTYMGLMTRERISKESVQKAAALISPYLPDDLEPSDRGLVRDLTQGLLFINLTLDNDRVEAAQEAAKREVLPIFVSRGTAVLTRGKTITAEEMAILSDLGVLNNGASRFLLFLSCAGLVLLVTGLIVAYLYLFHRPLLLATGSLFLIGLISLGVVTSAVFLGFLPAAWSGYLVPLPMGAMLLAILVDTRVSLVITALLSLLCGVAVGYQLQPALMLLAGSWAATFGLSRVGQRSDLARAGLIAAVVNFLTSAILGFLAGGPSNASILQRSLLGAVNGVGSSVLTIGLLPFLEQTFGVTSSIRLLELSNPNQPLLRRLLVEAPGTYHHSILVGNLAEAAAESIGANSLLVRVAAYYHDVGKMRRPYFFVENQIGQENPHEKLAPTLSTLIITSHVRDGVDLARDYRLPRAVIELIEQHHGTDLVRYFYARATESENSHRDRLRETDFRYAGPRPQTKEAAVLMLADSVEAASRAINKPTPARLESLIERMIKDRLDDGQFGDCNITIKELRLLSTAFARVLSGLFHTRIEYPEKVMTELERKRVTDAVARQ